MKNILYKFNILLLILFSISGWTISGYLYIQSVTWEFQANSYSALAAKASARLNYATKNIFYYQSTNNHQNMHQAMNSSNAIPLRLYEIHSQADSIFVNKYNETLKSLIPKEVP